MEGLLKFVRQGYVTTQMVTAFSSVELVDPTTLSLSTLRQLLSEISHKRSNVYKSEKWRAFASSMQSNLHRAIDQAGGVLDE